MEKLAAAAISLSALWGTAPTATSEPPQPITAGPATVTLVDSYYSVAAKQLVVVFELSAVEAVESNAYRALYLGPDGQQVEADAAFEPRDLLPGATAVVVIVFPAATPGGTVTWSIDDEEFNEHDIAVEVPVDGGGAEDG